MSPTDREQFIFIRRHTSPSSSHATTYHVPSSFPPIGSLRISDGGDYISRLPDALLSKILAHLLIKDVVRTTVLSKRWRHVRASTKLILDDVDLLPDLPDAVPSVLAAHSSPFNFVRLTHSCDCAAVHDDGTLMRSWLGVLAEKHVQDLALSNRRDANYPLPADLLCINSVHRLDLGDWDFPSTHYLCRDTDFFPYLHELGLWHINITATDIDRLLQFSPLLQKFALIASDKTPPSVLIRSRSVLCFLFWNNVANKVHVLAAPKLKRLILWSKWPVALGDEFCTRLIIGSVQELDVLDYLDARIHQLQIFDTLIQADTKPTLRTMIPCVKVLALKVRFGVPNEANMVPSYLRCFPNVEILHMMFDEDIEPTGKPSFKLWQEAGPIRCLQTKTKKLVFKNFKGKPDELGFLLFVWEIAELLQKIVVVLNDHASKEEVIANIKSQVSSRQCICRRSIMVCSGGKSWNFHIASDLSVSDPFDF